jgi:type I restriction enzyme, S subunit
MTNGWEAKRLGEVCSLLNRGLSPNYVNDGGVVVLNQRCVRDHRVNFDAARRHDVEAKSVGGERLLRAGDVLVNSTGTGTLGRVAQLQADPPEATTVDSHVTIVRPSPGLFFQKFFGYMLRDIEDEIKDSGEGCGGQTELNRSVLAERFVVRFPKALSEQQRIVRILDEAFEAIATAKTNAEKNLQNARGLFENYLRSVFTQRGADWVERPLGQVCDLLNGFAFRSEEAVQESSTQLVRMGNLYGNVLNLDRSPVFYPDSFASKFAKYLLREGDLILSLTGTTGKEDYGYAVKIPNCGHALLMNQRIAKFEFINEKILDQTFLLYYLRSRVFLDLLYATANGTRQANLSSVTIKTLPIPICSLDQQKSIAAALNKVTNETQRLGSIYQRKLATLDALKKSLLHQAFAGQL